MANNDAEYQAYLRSQSSEDAEYQAYLDAQGEPDSPVKPDPLTGMDYVSGGAGQFVAGATANFGDELIAGATAGIAHLGDIVGLDTVPKGDSVMDTYTQVRNNIRNRNKQFQQENPATSVGLNVAGGVLPIGKGMQIAGGTGKMMGVGAGYGISDYLGEIDKFSDFEVKEAMIRAGFGASIPMVFAGGMGAIHWLKNREVDEVASILDELKGFTGRTGEQIQKQADDLGADASLIDATGDVGIGAGQGIRGYGAMDVIDTLEKNLLPKVKQAKNKIRSALSVVTGKGQYQYHEKLSDLQTTRKANAEKLYGKALDEGTVVPTKKMLGIINNNPSVREAWERVQQVYERNDIPLPDLFKQNADGKLIGSMTDGKLTGTGKKFPNMRAIQELKWEMDRTLRDLGGSLDSAGKKEFSRLKADMNEFLGDVYKQNPAFKKANAQYAGDIALENAQQLGKKHGLNRGNVEDQLAVIEKLNPSEKSAYLQGVMSDVYSKLGSRPEENLGNISNIASENAQAVLTALIGKKGAQAVQKEINKQKRFIEVNTKVREGSQTQPREAFTEALHKRNKEFNVQDIKSIAVKNKAVQGALDLISHKYGKMDAGQMNELADLMTKAGGTAEAIKRMEMAGLNKYEVSDIIKILSTAGVSYSGADTTDVPQ